MPGFIPPVTELGKPGLDAARVILGDGWILVVESWTITVGWDAAASEIQETLESRPGGASSRLGGLGRAVCDMGQGSDSCCNRTFPCRAQTALLTFGRETPSQLG